MLVDARALVGSGIARYLRIVLARLVKDARFGSVTLMGDPAQISAFLADHRPQGPTVRTLPLWTPFYSPRMQLQWLMHSARGSLHADVAFFPHYDAPLLAFPGRSVVAIHDLIHFRAPDFFPIWRRLPASVVFRNAVAHATRVITVSEFTRRDLLEWMPEAAAKTEVVLNGVSAVARPATSDAKLAGEIEGLRPYLLCVGNRKPHKNLGVAVEALALLGRDGAEARLVVVGPPSPEWAPVLQRAESLGVAGAIVDRGEVGEAELAMLYGRCEAFLFPSLYEGFGLPVLEAMACGAPVIASNRTSVPEVVGDAGLLVDPESAPEIAAAVRRLRSEPELRDRLIARGTARAAELSWDATSARTVDVLYETAVGSPGVGR